MKRKVSQSVSALSSTDSQLKACSAHDPSNKGALDTIVAYSHKSTDIADEQAADESSGRGSDDSSSEESDGESSGRSEESSEDSSQEESESDYSPSSSDSVAFASDRDETDPVGLKLLLLVS
jgi:hypothetical protein